MKIIFLDIDGVLNSESFVRGKEGLIVDPKCMALLKQIVDATAARIVLTSSWREHWRCDGIGRQLDQIFGEYGLEVLDKTPQQPRERQAQIQAWLEANPQVRQFVVLDDRLMYADFLKEHFVKTSNFYGGLDETDAQRAMGILNEDR